MQISHQLLGYLLHLLAQCIDFNIDLRQLQQEPSDVSLTSQS